jgi:hypothetical protein
MRRLFAPKTTHRAQAHCDRRLPTRRETTMNRVITVVLTCLTILTSILTAVSVLMT